MHQKTSLSSYNEYGQWSLNSMRVSNNLQKTSNKDLHQTLCLPPKN